MTTPDIPSAQQPEPDPPARPEPGPPKDPDGYVLLIYEPERYIPREPYVDQLDIHILMGPGLRHPLCFRCGQEKNDPEHENPVWHACLNACIHCESDDHPCPRLYCSTSWWKKWNNKIRLPAECQIRPDFEERRTLLHVYDIQLFADFPVLLSQFIRYWPAEMQEVPEPFIRKSKKGYTAQDYVRMAQEEVDGAAKRLRKAEMWLGAAEMLEKGGGVVREVGSGDLREREI